MILPVVEPIMLRREKLFPQRSIDVGI